MTVPKTTPWCTSLMLLQKGPKSFPKERMKESESPAGFEVGF